MTNTVYDEYALAYEMLKLTDEEKYQTLLTVSKLLSEPEIHKFFSFPKISGEEKKEILEQSLSGIDKKLLYFFYVLIDNERFLEIDKIVQAYEKILDNKKDILVFELETAFALDDEKENEIKRVLKNKFNKNIVLKITIKDKLIGGLVLKQNGKIFDASILNRIESLKESLKEVRN